MTDKEIFKFKADYLATCPKGMEDFLFNELKELGLKNLIKSTGGIHFEGDNKEFIKVVLYSRIASRVYKKLFAFDVKTEKDFYHRGLEIKWKAVFNLDQTFKIQTILVRSPNGEKKSKFTNTMILSQTLKDGIVDRFREDTEGHRPNVNKQNADVSLVVHVSPHDNIYASKERVTIMLDLSGIPLSNRGYRDSGFEAPLRENLAAALIRSMNWDKTSNFIDGMCGSGTMLIEALMYKANIPAAYYQLLKGARYAFIYHNFFAKDKELTEAWEKEYKKAVEAGAKGVESLRRGKKLLGFDISHHHINLSLDHLAKCQLDKAVVLTRADFTNLANSFDPGIIFLNPPYGERMGEDDNLEKLYFDIGENLKKEFKGNKAFIFTGNLPLIKKIQLKTKSKTPFFNGDIECRLVCYELY